MLITKASEKDVKFLAGHESFVSKTYYCPAGVLTIGYGFTMSSRVFAEEWRKMKGRALKPGDTISRTEADRILRRMLDEEYGAAVVKAVQPKEQHHFGAATSTTFNCGPGALKWKWALALRAGNIAEAARLLRNTAVTANGRKLAGLVRRRKEEAELLEHGRYPGTPVVSKRAPAASVRQYQQWLKELGYYKGKVDGVHGKQTTEAVRAFQRATGLVVDGKVGPATLSTLIREKDAKAGGAITGGTGAATTTGVGAEGVLNGSLPSWEAIAIGVGVIVLVAGAVWLYRNRGKITGKRVPVAV